jgi:putative heme-binding domain-containing protein
MTRRSTMTKRFRLIDAILILTVAVFCATDCHAADPKLQFEKGDHVAYIGNTLADRMQHHAWLETYLQALFPKHELTFRDLGYSADEVKRRDRADSFGSPDQWLTKVQADTVFCFFGRNEALNGDAGLEGFKKDLGEMLDAMGEQKYNGKSAPRIVVFSPIAHENLKSPLLPDGSAQNVNLEKYTAAMQTVCADREIQFVDIFTPTKSLYASASKLLTMNGIHLLDHGNKALAEVIVSKLADKSVPADVAKLREAVLDKNLHWFSRYRVVDEYNVFGGRSKLNWDGVSNADVMGREMEIFDIKTANRDKHIWAIAQGKDTKVNDDNLPGEVEVVANKQSRDQRSLGEYLSGKEAISKMTIHKGMEVNLFASEEKFPRLINPVQMAVDTDSRVWVSVWPSYPHWNPTQPRRDALLIFPDDNNDGEADECIVFADKLNSVTGFEFWGGGVLVAAPPEIWFLKDTDGDDKADLKIRMLQGVSSADTHHSANAVVVGPAGWMYWSRGIFNTANFETPTRKFTGPSRMTGVHRFNPRTFEFEFHFPIGPNPHGDVFDQWGYQFVSDGTGGTGSYVNIGKGIGNKKWYQKRVRPVPATGILSSSHFPPEHEGNFLICNAIGFLGVLQHEVKYDGADITAEEVDPILVSSDPNFRPSDIEVGGDGALYVTDWHNALIGHMQHNMRDPNRDHEHGRIYRVTAEGRDLVKPAKMKGKPIAEVCENFFAAEDSTRYRARLELTGRGADEIAREVGAFAAKLNPKNVGADGDEAQALLESLWVFEEQGLQNTDLLAKVFEADEPRVRAAAIRTLGHWGQKETEVSGWQDVLRAASRDDSALVRAEAVKAAVSFEGVSAAEVIFEVATKPTDPELDTALKYAKGQIAVDKLIQDAIASNKPLSKAAMAYSLLNASVSDLLKLERTEAVYEAILSRQNVPASAMRDSLSGLAGLQEVKPLSLLLKLIEGRDAAGQTAGLGSFSQLLNEQPVDDLQNSRDRIEDLALKGKAAGVRQLGYAALIQADRAGNGALFTASKSKASLRDLLAAVPSISDVKLRGSLYQDVRSLMFELPPNLEPEQGGSGLSQSGIKVDYFYPSASNVAVETLAKMTPKASGIVPQIVMNVPQKKQADRFALRFTGSILIPKAGKYTFFTRSDDGSRLYLDEKLLVNNDGLHGMVEKNGSANLTAGSHDIIVTYFDNGGGDGLTVSWSGPGLKKQAIAADRLAVSGGGDTLHDVAIRSLASIPGHESEKFADLSQLIRAGRNRTSAIDGLRAIPEQHWPEKGLDGLIDNLVGYLSAMPARLRTGGAALDAIALTRSISKKLPAAAAKSVEERLQNLDVRVIAIGTVPARMIYDKETIVVQAGKAVEFRFLNSDHMPHNFAIVQPGALEEIGMQAEATARDADAKERHYVPKSDKVMLASRLLEPGQSQALTFDTPTTPGVYPYVCTYPGHWRRMFGALYVVANLEEYQASPEKYLAANPLPLKDELLKFTSRNTEWKFEDLNEAVAKMKHGRSFETAKNLFKVASCVACHKVNNEGRELGPDLTKIDPKKHSKDHILRSLIEPSKEIAEKFQSNTFVLDSGKVVTGMVVEETAKQVKVLIDPLGKAAPIAIDKDVIDVRIKSKLSIMPKGVLSKLTEEEILDLVAYIFAKGDKKHMLFHMDHNH